MDLDGFKRVNDTHGHSAGDRLLKSVAERLLACVREEDLVARMGGDEFCVLLDGIKNPRDAAIVAQKLIGELGRLFVFDGIELTIAASVGISCYPKDGPDIAALLQCADSAMYRAKEHGSNAFRFHSGEVEAAA